MSDSRNDDVMTQKQLRFVIIGAGMSGLLAAIRLRDDKFSNVTILEKAHRIGGTWRENVYPGLYCDVPAHAYTYSFAPNPEWSGHLAPGDEIQRYFEDICTRYGLWEIIRFGHEVTRCEFSGGCWTIMTARGLIVEADVVIAATGVLHHPNMPEIAGLPDFAGPAFHTARWPDTLDVTGKRVGIIGNGSTGVQIVSAIASQTAQVVHFQRTPQWIMPVDNRRYTPEEKAAFRSDIKKIDEIRFGEPYLSAVRSFTNGIVDAQSPEMADVQEAVRANLEQSVADPVLREKLRPNYRAACKRLIMSPDYYQVVQRENVDIVVSAIDRIEAGAVRTKDEQRYGLDVLVLATGFRADRFIRPAQVIGANGRALDDVWAKRPSAYLAISIPDFPNFFFLNGPTSPVGNFSLIDIAERQWDYIRQLIDVIASGPHQHICATHRAMDAYERARIEAARKTIFGSGCISWYLDADGVPSTWPWTYDRFAEAMARPQIADFDCFSADTMH